MGCKLGVAKQVSSQRPNSFAYMGRDPTGAIADTDHHLNMGLRLRG